MPKRDGPDCLQDIQPTYSGYSIERWIDSGYDVIEAQTRADLTGWARALRHSIDLQLAFVSRHRRFEAFFG